MAADSTEAAARCSLVAVEPEEAVTELAERAVVTSAAPIAVLAADVQRVADAAAGSRRRASSSCKMEDANAALHSIRSVCRSVHVSRDLTLSAAEDWKNEAVLWTLLNIKRHPFQSVLRYFALNTGSRHNVFLIVFKLLSCNQTLAHSCHVKSCLSARLQSNHGTRAHPFTRDTPTVKIQREFLYGT
jgi:hypothetical protein